MKPLRLPENPNINEVIEFRNDYFTRLSIFGYVEVYKNKITESLIKQNT